MLHVEWYHICWPRLTAKRVEPVVSISWASCYSSYITSDRHKYHQTLTRRTHNSTLYFTIHCERSIENTIVGLNFLQQLLQTLTDLNNFCTKLTRNELCISQYQNFSLHRARCYASAPNRRGISDDAVWRLTSVCLTSVCLSVCRVRA